MKKISRILILFSFILISFSVSSCNSCDTQNVVSDHIITLHVDTDNINQQNRDSMCYFGDVKGVSNKDYTTFVKLNDVITWIGVSSSSTDSVEVRITKIKFKKGRNILNKKELKGKKKVNGKIKRGKVGDIEEYKVQFAIYLDGKKIKGPFTIDPKLQIIE